MTEANITNESARKMRQDLGLTQKEFWGPVGVAQSVGARYEDDVKIPRPVRILIVARYVGGLKIAADTPQDISDIQLMADVQRKLGTAKALARKVSKDLDRAAGDISAAKASLQGI